MSFVHFLWLQRITQESHGFSREECQQIVQCLHPNWIEHSLDRVLMRYEIPIEGRHTADGDALMTAKLWQLWLELMNSRGIKTLEDLYIVLSKRK